MFKNKACTQLIRISQTYKSSIIETGIKWCQFKGVKRRGREDSERHRESGGSLAGLLRMDEIQVFTNVPEKGKKCY